MTQMLCDEPPPPPPGVEDLAEDADAETVRERLEQHRAAPACAGSHETMDNLGFGMEHFDAIGAWRDEDHGFPVDAAGVLPDGTSFYGGREMAAIVAEDPEFPECVTEQLFIYGMGRGITSRDGVYLGEISEAWVEADMRLEDLVVGIVTAAPFRMRRGGEP